MSEPVKFTAAALAPVPAANPGLAPDPPLSAPSDRPVEADRTHATTAEVVLVTRNSRAELAGSLPAIVEAAAAANAQLLFVDLGSTDGTQSFAAGHAPGARAVWLTDRDGPKDALAAAAAVSEADVLVMLSPTLEPSSPDSFLRLVEHLDDHPYASIAAPALRAGTGELLSTARPAPRPRECSRVEWVLDAAFAIRRADLTSVTHASGRLSPSLQDLLVCLQLRRRGREVHYVRSIELLDTGGQAAKQVGKPPLGASLLAWGRLLVRHPRYALRLAGRRRFARRVAWAITRAMEISVALLLLTLLSPLMLAIAIAIRLDSKGPALFRQLRLGRGGRPFHMYKFRTMRRDADPTPHAHFMRDVIRGRLPAADGPGGDHPPIFKLHPDPRVTRVGRVLRRMSFDELPQLLNVLRGEMTLVGFRPPIPYEVAEYPAWYHRRFDGKPGMTGLWQVSGRNELSYEEMVRLDIEYLNRRSWLFSLIVLVRTVGAVIGGRGAV